MPHQPYREAHICHDEPRRGRELVTISHKRRVVQFHYFQGMTVEDCKEMASKARAAGIYEAGRRMGVATRSVNRMGRHHRERLRS